MVSWGFHGIHGIPSDNHSLWLSHSEWHVYHLYKRVTPGNDFPLACRFEARKLTQTQKMAVSDAHWQKYSSKPHPSGRIIKHTSQQKSNRQLLDSPSLPTHRSWLHGEFCRFCQESPALQPCEFECSWARAAHRPRILGPWSGTGCCTWVFFLRNLQVLDPSRKPRF